jgi:hypothetical protein
MQQVIEQLSAAVKPSICIQEYQVRILVREEIPGIDSFSAFQLYGSYYFLEEKPGSSVSIVSGYGLDDRAIEVRSPAEAKGFFL